MADSYSHALLEATRSAAEPWLRRITDVVIQSQMLDVDPELVARRTADVGALLVDELESLLSLDVEQQRRNPLDVFRSAAVTMSEFLVGHGAMAVERDEFLQRAFPDDACALAPASWSDIDESMTGPGLEWGAFKAATVISRHRAGRVTDPT